MGLFMNSNGHPDVFKNDTMIVEQNQSYSKIDSLSEWMQEQQAENVSLHRHINDLELLLKQQKKYQSNQMKLIRNRLSQLQDNDVRFEQVEEHITKSLERLDDKNQEFHKMLADGQAVNEEFKVQLMSVGESSKEVVHRLEQVASANEDIFVQIHGQSDRYQQLTEQILQHEDVQKVVIRRLDDQEGVTGKIVRQVDHLRGVLYERTNFLTGKIESSYTMTASYLAKLLANAEQPMTRFRMNPKSEEKQRNSD